MVTQLQAREHYLSLYNGKAVYVWGMNANTIISKDTIDKTFKIYGSSKYNKEYYDYKLSSGKGKVGSDCSGAHYPISGYDTTAQGYYNKCTKKGSIDTLPKDKLVLLFKSSDNTPNKICHTGAYLGDGTCIHMASSTRNCVHEEVSKHGWTHWGYADFIYDYDTYSFKTSGDKIIEYTQKDFIDDVCAILNVNNAKKALSKTITISKTQNNNHALVTPLERYMKALGYYSGDIEVDERKLPSFGSGMEKAIKKYQKNMVHATVANQDGIITAKKNTWKKLLSL